MDIISEFNSRDREPDIDYPKWVSESKGSSQIKKTNIVTHTNSVRGLESEVECSDGTGHEGRGSPDSGVMVAYSEEPKVRRPDIVSSDSDSGIKSEEESTGQEQSQRPRTVQVTLWLKYTYIQPSVK